MRKSVAGLTTMLAASVATAAWLWTELRAERARNAALGERIAALSDSATRATTSARAPAAEGIQRADAAPTPTPDPSRLAPSTLTGQPSKEDWASYQRRLMQDPKFREARRAQQKLAYAPRRANFIRLIGMTPEQADSAIDLGLDHEYQMQEAANIEAHVNESHEERQARLDVLEAAYQDQLRTLLGEDKRQRLSGYMETRRSRMQVDELRSELSESNVLRDDQVEPLIAALHTERSRMDAELTAFRSTLTWDGDARESWTRYSEREAQLRKETNARMLESAATILTTAQTRALADQLTRELARFEAQQRLIRIQSNLDAANPAATPPN